MGAASERCCPFFFIWRASKMFSITVTPRFGDVDGLRHINNCVIPQWFELARNPIFELMPNFKFGYETWDQILAHIDIDFVGQLRFGSDVEIRTYVSRVGACSYTLYQEAWQNGKLGAKGSTVIVCFNFKMEKPKPVSDELRRRLSEHLINKS